MKCDSIIIICPRNIQDYRDTVSTVLYLPYPFRDDSHRQEESEVNQGLSPKGSA